MNLDIMISLAFLSYYRYSFFCLDFIIFMIGMMVYYHLTYKLLPSIIPEEKKKKYNWIRKMLSFLLGVQIFCYLFMFLMILPQKPVFVNKNTDIGIMGFLFVIMIICRFITIIMLITFLMSCWWMIEKKDRWMIQKWYTVFSLFIVYYVYILFYMLFPTWNKALMIYELFYNIRNLYITKDPQKMEKTISYLQTICIPTNYYPLYEYEWKRTFKDQIVVSSCSFS